MAAMTAWAPIGEQPVWQGVLRNAGGAPIAGAKVRLAANGVQADSVTGADGTSS